MGPSDFDHKHRLVLSWVWDLPKVPNGNGFVKALVNGWQWSGIGQFQTGSPFTIKSGQDNSRTGLNNDRAVLTGVSLAPVAIPGTNGLAANDKRNWMNAAAFDRCPNRATDPTCALSLGTFGTLGRNTYYGPGLTSWDMGMFKEFRFRERFGVQFRAEFFNIFNHANFDNPGGTGTGASITSNMSVGQGNFGVLSRTNPAGGDPRIIQFGLKLAF